MFFIVFIIVFFCCLRIDESCIFTAPEYGKILEKDGEEFLEITTVETKTSTCNDRALVVTVAKMEDPRNCPVEAWKRLEAKAKSKGKKFKLGSEDIFFIMDSTQTPIDKGRLQKMFKKFIKFARKKMPSLRGLTLTLHVFRISGIGFLIVELDAPPSIAKHISRHKNDAVLEVIYAAKSDHRARLKFAKLIKE